MKRKNTSILTSMILVTLALLFVSSLYAQGGRPDQETMWFDGQIVNITASDWLPQSAPLKVQNNVFVVVYRSAGLVSVSHLRSAIRATTRATVLALMIFTITCLIRFPALPVTRVLGM